MTRTASTTTAATLAAARCGFFLAIATFALISVAIRGYRIIYRRFRAVISCWFRGRLRSSDLAATATASRGRRFRCVSVSHLSLNVRGIAARGQLGSIGKLRSCRRGHRCRGHLTAAARTRGIGGLEKQRGGGKKRHVVIRIPLLRSVLRLRLRVTCCLSLRRKIIGFLGRIFNRLIRKFLVIPIGSSVERFSALRFFCLVTQQ